MINYSVAKRLNPLNQEEHKFYAVAQISEVYSLSQFVKHICDHNSVYSRGTVTGVVIEMVHCLKELLLEGKKIKLGELGDFSLTLQSKGTQTANLFSASNITAVNLLFTPSVEFADMLDDADFQQVSSRAAQAATLKAEKAGETTVDISKKTTTNDENTSDDNTQTGDNTNGGDNGGGSSTSDDNGEGGLG